MKIKLLLFLFVFILSFSTVFASYDDAILYYSFDNSDLSGSNPLDLSSSGFDGTTNGATTGAAGILGEAFSFDGTNDYVSKSTESALELTGGSYSYSLWFEADPSIVFGTNRRLIAKDDGADFSGGWGTILQTQITLMTTHNPGGNSVATIDSRNTSQWYHLVVTYNDSTNALKMYLDGSEVGSYTRASNVATETDSLCIGTYCSGTSPSGQYWKGKIDEVAIYDYNIGTDGVAALWNNGAGYNPYGSGSFTSNLTLIFVDEWNNSINVDDLNVTIDGTTYTNSTGNVIYTDIPVNASQTHDIEVQAHQYFSRTFTSETMEDKTLQLFQSDITFEGRTIVSNTTKAANFTIGSQTNGNFYLTAGTYQISVQSSPFDKNHTFTVAALDNRTELVYIPDHLLTLGVINNRNSAFINGTKTGWYENTANNFNESFNFTGDTIDIELEAGLNYDFFLNPVGGYATNEGLNFQYTATGNNNTRNFQLFENNSVQFYFKNGDSLAFITSDINASLANANNTYNFNTSNGEYFLSGIDGGTYTLTAQTSGFNPVEVFVTVLNNEYQELNVFFGEDVESRIFTVTDRQGNPIEGVVVTFTRQINGTTVVYGQQTTDFSGGIQMFLNPSDIYDLTALKAGYNTFSGSVTPFRSSYTINMEQEGSQRFISTFDDISYRNNFSHVQNTTTGEAWFEIVSAAGYLQYWGMSTSYNGTTYFQNNTGTPSGGTIQFNITNINTSQQNTLEVVYWFKSVNSSFIQWNETYLINNRLGQDNLGDWDFSDQPTGAKAIITLFIVLLSGGIGIAITRRTLGGVILGGLGIGFAMIVGWTPLLFGTLTLGVLAIVLISDLSTGENR